VTGSDLNKRIEAIMTNRTTHALSTTKTLLLGSAGVAAIVGPIVVGFLNAPPMQAQAPVTHSRVAVRPEALTIALIKQNTSAVAPQGNLPTVCEMPVPPPAASQLPPAGSGPVLWLIAPCFAAQGNVSLVNVQTYLSYVQLKENRSKPSQGLWTPYNDSLQSIIKDDFNRLLNTNLLADLRIDVTDYTFSNGVVGKIVVYNMEERRRPAEVVLREQDHDVVFDGTALRVRHKS
jgi:hypothetical protein